MQRNHRAIMLDDHPVAARTLLIGRGLATPVGGSGGLHDRRLRRALEGSGWPAP